MPSANNISAIKIHIPMIPNMLKPLSVALLFSIVAGCASVKTNTPKDCSCPNPDQPATEKAIEPALLRANVSELPGWLEFDHADWMKAFADQCNEKNDYLGKRKSTPEALLGACKEAAAKLAGNPDPENTTARDWMGKTFDAYQLQKEDGTKEGLLTGYFEPMLQGARQAQGKFQHPLFAQPADLITVELASIYPELKGKRLRGRLQGDKLVPFFDREQWEQIGPSRERPLVWINDALDAFLLQVQGSGRVELRDGKEIRLSYANQNGHPYVSIGRSLVKQGELTVEQATIPGIRKWAEQNPSKLETLLNTNPSVVFFQENPILKPEEGPVGALGIPLTGMLSIAVDRQRIGYGTPLWIKSTHPITGKPITQGGLAQDTGGAIRGRVRADYFWGTGPVAGEAAGLTRQPLQMWVLWPKGQPEPEIK